MLFAMMRSALLMMSPFFAAADAYFDAISADDAAMPCRAMISRHALLFLPPPPPFAFTLCYCLLPLSC